MTKKPKFTDEELKWIELLRAAFEASKDEPDDGWLDSLPEYVPLPEESNETVAVFIQKKPGKTAAKKKSSKVAGKKKPGKTAGNEKSSKANPQRQLELGTDDN